MTSTILIAVKKGEQETQFPYPKAVPLANILLSISEKNISLEEAEELAGISSGTLLVAIQAGVPISPIDSYKIFEALSKIEKSNL